MRGASEAFCDDLIILGHNIIILRWNFVLSHFYSKPLNKMDERQQKRILGLLADIDNEEIIGGVEDDDKDAEF